MLQSRGLFTYIRNTRLKTVAILLAYVLVALITSFALSVMMAVAHSPGTLATKLDAAYRLFGMEWHRFLLGAVLWAVLASMLFRREVNNAVSAHGVSRTEAPRLYNIVENLAISTGISVPAINIVETPSTNAFMAGLMPSRMSLAVTRGLLNQLNDAELNAVIAHEFVKVVSGDARRIGLATVFTGICLYLATFILKPFYRPSFRMLVVLLALPFYPYELGAIMAVSVLAAVLGAVALKLLVGKLHVYVADAGSLELTKDSESLVSAIRKMSLNNQLDGANLAVRPLLFAGTEQDWFSSHPTADERIAAINTYVPSNATPGSFAYPTIKMAQPDWRDQFEIPAWVSGGACLIPVCVFAVYCGVTSNWTSVNREEVLALNSEIQKTLELSLAVSPPGTEFMTFGYAYLYEWTYGVDVDIEKLRRMARENRQAIAKATKNKPPMFTSISSGSGDRFEHHAAYIIGAALKDKSRLAKALYDAGLNCVVRHDNSPLGQKLGRDWANGFSALAHHEAFQEKRFPAHHEISRSLMETDNKSRPEDLFDADTKEGRALMGFLRKKGLGSTWSSRSCVFGHARKMVEQWVPRSELKTLGVRAADIKAMEDALGKPDIPVPDPSVIVLEQMQIFEDAARNQAEFKKLQQASWNRGTKPASAVWIPALLLFGLWQIFRSFGRLGRFGTRLVRG
jgi:heat shock protein HtpX